MLSADGRTIILEAHNQEARGDLWICSLQHHISNLAAKLWTRYPTSMADFFAFDSEAAIGDPHAFLRKYLDGVGFLFIQRYLVSFGRKNFETKHKVLQFLLVHLLKDNIVT
jgi:hypothetical protein